MSYYVYIVKCRDGSFYTGSSNNVERRIREHNNSYYGAKSLRGKRPVALVYSETFVNKIEGAIPEENEYVAIYVNGEYAQEGISTLKAENGMEIEFRVEEIKPPA